MVTETKETKTSASSGPGHFYKQGMPTLPATYMYAVGGIKYERDGSARVKSFHDNSAIFPIIDLVVSRHFVPPMFLLTSLHQV